MWLSAPQQGSIPDRVYVAGKDVAARRVFVAHGGQHPALYTRSALLSAAAWATGSPPAALALVPAEDCALHVTVQVAVGQRALGCCQSGPHDDVCNSHTHRARQRSWDLRRGTAIQLACAQCSLSLRHRQQVRLLLVIHCDLSLHKTVHTSSLVSQSFEVPCKLFCPLTLACAAGSAPFQRSSYSRCLDASPLAQPRQPNAQLRVTFDSPARAITPGQVGVIDLTTVHALTILPTWNCRNLQFHVSASLNV